MKYIIIALTLVINSLYADNKAVVLMATAQLMRMENAPLAAGKIKTATRYDDHGQYSIGFGTEWTPDLPITISRKTAIRLLQERVEITVDFVDRVIKVPLSLRQHTALVCMAYNIGHTSFAKSTLVKKLNGGDYAAVPSEMRKWVYAGGRPILEGRREKEIALWLKED